LLVEYQNDCDENEGRLAFNWFDAFLDIARMTPQTDRIGLRRLSPPFLMFLITTPSIHSYQHRMRAFGRWSHPGNNAARSAICSIYLTPAYTTTTATEIDTYNHESWVNGYSTVEKELCFELENEPESDGSSSLASFPPDLVGTFYQNGPSKFVIGQDLVLHPFDGDGMITALTFRPDPIHNRTTAWFRNRFVRTTGYTTELKNNKICFRGIFGTAKNKGKWYSNIFDVRIKNVANTNVLFVPSLDSGTTPLLFALWEGGRPHGIDPISLATLPDPLHPESVEHTLGGTLRNAMMDRYAAHYKTDPSSKQVVNFGIRVVEINRFHDVIVYEHDLELADASDENKANFGLFRPSRQARFTLPGFSLSHDIAITSRYVVMFHLSTTVDLFPFLVGAKSFAQCISPTSSTAGLAGQAGSTGSCFYFLPRPSARGVKVDPISVPVPNGFAFHLVNAYETTCSNTGHELVIVDAIMANRMAVTDKDVTTLDATADRERRPLWETIDFASLPAYSFRRYYFDLSTRSLLRIVPMTGADHSGSSTSMRGQAHTFRIKESITVDFPVVHPAKVGQPYRYAYVLGSASSTTVSPVQGLLKIDALAGRCIARWMPSTEDEFLSEVVFIPRSKPDDVDTDIDEDYGYLLGYLMNGRLRTTSVVVFDAKEIGMGPICNVTLRQPFLSHSLHGIFVPNFAPDVNDVN
jgi:all-trans-8'-apo-beta-carotenal 15,15'-oxygenase